MGCFLRSGFGEEHDCSMEDQVEGALFLLVVDDLSEADLLDAGVLNDDFKIVLAFFLVDQGEEGDL